MTGPILTDCSLHLPDAQVFKILYVIYVCPTEVQQASQVLFAGKVIFLGIQCSIYVRMYIYKYIHM